MRGLAAAGIAAILGLMVWAVVEHQRWESQCEQAGGRVERRFEYMQQNAHYTYGPKGNITGVWYSSDPVYSWHCWLNDREIEV
ncbi:hypothetical protein ACIA8K_12760 [Catenuloplanes sp. NPDC051500]|uniref:hypothetical protein n=1 Tax=Catenuloplanes sp. NPDC051500 TaxID=3363959 RepID=UPI0037987A45